MKKIRRIICLLSLVVLASCTSNTPIADIKVNNQNIPSNAKIIVNGLSMPKVNKDHEFTGKYAENTILEYSYYNKYNDSSGAIRKLFEKNAEKFQIANQVQFILIKNSFKMNV